MSGGLYSRVHTWSTNEYLNSADLNAEFDNIINNCDAIHLGGYSNNVAQMQVTVTPGATGTESLASSIADELARLRFVIKRILGSGSTNWYDGPIIDLTQSNSLLANAAPLAANRIISGRKRSGSNFPIFLVPDGTAATINFKATATSLSAYINNTAFTFSTDTSLAGLTLAPSSQNTCTVNDATLGSAEYTRLQGESGTSITVTSMGTNIQALVGKYAAFKVGTEYFIGYVASTTSISRCFRGYFFDSTDSPIKRATIANSATITLMKLTWVFINTVGGIAVTYNNPTWSKKTPSSASIGDYWFDLANNTWKTYTGVAWTSAAATLAGVCLQDTAGTKAARCFEYYAIWDDTNTITIEQVDNSTVQAKQTNSKISVSGNLFNYGLSYVKWSTSVDMDSGVSLASSTAYFLYVTEAGDSVVSDIAPFDRRADLKGSYHPFNPWRCVGRVFSDGSSHISTTVANEEVSLSPDMSGSTKIYVGTTAPDGYIFCDGQAINRVQFYNLWGIMGPGHGQGDNSTTFNIPDHRGRFIRGTDNMGTTAGAASRDPDSGSRAAMATGGNTNNNVGSCQTDGIKSHVHQYNDVTQGGGGVGSPGGSGFFGGNNTSATGGNETRPINAYENIMIRY